MCRFLPTVLFMAKMKRQMWPLFVRSTLTDSPFPTFSMTCPYRRVPRPPALLLFWVALAAFRQTLAAIWGHDNIGKRRHVYIYDVSMFSRPVHLVLTFPTLSSLLLFPRSHAPYILILCYVTTLSSTHAATPTSISSLARTKPP